jgi:DNA-binding NarL/FixJ family response regulator
MTVRILVVDDHPVVRQGLRALIASRSEWEIIDEAEDGIQAVERAIDCSQMSLSLMSACLKWTVWKRADGYDEMRRSLKCFSLRNMILRK